MQVCTCSGYINTHKSKWREKEKDKICNIILFGKFLVFISIIIIFIHIYSKNTYEKKLDK